MMTVDAFETALVRYGTELETWPQEVAAEARTLLDQSAAARALLSEEQALNALLVQDRVTLTDRALDTVRAQIVAAAHRLPQQYAHGRRPMSLSEALAAVFRLPKRFSAVIMPTASLATIALLGFLAGWAQIAVELPAQQTFDLTQLAFGADMTAWSYDGNGGQ